MPLAIEQRGRPILGHDARLSPRFEATRLQAVDINFQADDAM